MKRSKISALLAGPATNEQVTVMGWVKAFRSNRFIALNDGSCMGNLQVVVDFEQFDEALLDRVTVASSVSVSGKLVESQGKGQTVEVLAETIEIIGDANPEEVSKTVMQPKKHSMEFLREQAHLRFRTNTFGAVFRIRHHLGYAIHKYFNDNGFHYLHTPIITASDAEGAGEIFRVTTLPLSNVPFKSERFDTAAQVYTNKILAFSKERPEVSKVVEIIDEKIKMIDVELSFKKLLNARQSVIFNLKNRYDDFEILNPLFQKLLTILANDGFFIQRRVKTAKGRRTNYYFPDWFYQRVNQSRKGVMIRRELPVHPYKYLSLCFFNFQFVIKELRSSGDRHVDYDLDFFGRETNLTVSGQLEAEMGALALGQVYTFGPTFRAENSNTTRHLAEFWMIEPEVAFADIHDNMDLAEDFMQYVIHYVMENCRQELEFLRDRELQDEKSKPQNERHEMDLIERLKFVVENPFERITYTEAINILMNSKPYKKKKFKFPVEWGIDMQSEHERYIVEKHFKKPVIVTDYPAKIKAFYMRLNDPKEGVPGETVAAMDVLFPGIGEITGGSQREERLDVLTEKCKEFDIEPDSLWWYLDSRKFGTVPHAGFGLGFERLVMFVTGMTNIRDVIPFPRTPKSAEF